MDYNIDNMNYNIDNKLHHIIQSKSFKQSISFGIISSAMTALGISLGVWSSSGNLKSIVASIIGLSISNSLADAFSMYMADKASSKHVNADKSALFIAFIEFILPYLFLIPFLVFKLNTAVSINSVIGIILVALTGYYISVINNKSRIQTIEDITLYILITLFIIILTYIGGKTVNKII